jgi:acyl-CoA synthetase (NDP forming)
MNEARHRNLRRLLNPRSVVLVGGRTLEPAIAMLRRGGFAGRLYVVNPFQQEIGGVACTPSIADLPEAPDAAFLSVNRHLTVEAVRALAAIGAGGAVCFASGFGEMGKAGETLERRLIDGAGDLALVGPNSNGLLNRLDRLALWPTENKEFTPLETGVAIVAQSGGIAGMFVRDRRGVLPAVIVSTGNQTLLEPADWVQVLSQDPRIRAIGLFIEGPGNVAALSVAAQSASAKGLPVVALKSGRSVLGAQMAATHTGSLAGDDALFDALCARLGFLRAATLGQMTEMLKALGAWGGLRGRRMVMVTASGAARTLFADAASDAGLEFPEPSAAMALRLRPQLPEFAHVSNPLDFNAAYTGTVGLTLENEPALLECFRTVLSDGFDVGLLHSDWTDFGPEGAPTLRAWMQATREQGTAAAMTCLMPENMSRQAQEICRANGLASLQGLEDAMAAIAAAAAHGERMHAAAALHSAALAGPVLHTGTRRTLNEWESKARLEQAGIPFPRRRRVKARPELDEAARAIGFPLVLKALSAALPHKHSVGAVALGLADATALGAALARMTTALQQEGVVPEGFLVEEMVGDSRAELIVGIKASAIYGQALVIGAGGVDTERLRDSTTLLLPASDAAILSALAELRVASALDAPARKAVVQMAQDTARYAQQHQEELLSLDLNPVIVTVGGRVVAVDALIEIQETA